MGREMPWIPMFGTSKFVRWIPYYWTGVPDNENFYEGPLVAVVAL